MVRKILKYCQIVLEGLLFTAFLTPVVFASPAFSPIIIVDTRGDGDIAVYGRVLDGDRNVPLSGASLTLGGDSATSGSDGTFVFRNVTVDIGSTLRASALGYGPQVQLVTPPNNAKSVVIGDIRLVPIGAGPVVEWVKLDGADMFLPGWGTTFKATARVNWNGFVPTLVSFSANGIPVQSLTGPGPEYEVEFSVDSHFVPSMETNGNRISVLASGHAQPPMDPVQASGSGEAQVVVLPFPRSLKTFATDPANKSSDGKKLKLKVDFPSAKPIGTFELPIFGTWGGEAAVSGEFTFNMRSGEWELSVGREFEEQSGEFSALKLFLSPIAEDVKVGIEGTVTGIATRSRAIDFSSFEIASHLELGGEFELTRISPIAVLGPVAPRLKNRFPVLHKSLSVVSVIIWLKPRLVGETGLKMYPELGFKDLEFTGSLALEASYEPTIGNQKIKLYIGGEPSVKFGLPGEFLREYRFKAYAGLEASVWTFKTDWEYVFIDVASTPSSSSEPEASEMVNSVVESIHNSDSTWQPMARPWRESAGNGSVAPAVSEALEEAEDPSEFPIQENVFPESEPTLAKSDNDLMLLFVRDSGAANPIQFTEIAYSRFDGTVWSNPTALSADVRGQFNPQVSFDGDGNAIAVYERIKDSSFSGGEMEDFAALMEIVWSRWDSATQTWSAPQPLTDNAFLDFNAHLAGPLANGDLLLTWNQNEANQISGSGVLGAATNMKVMSRRWDSSGRTWTAPEVLVPGLTGELSGSLAAASEIGLFIWTEDLDGDTVDSGDSELFFRLYNSASQTWGATQRYTSDEIADRNAGAAILGNGDIYVIWRRGNDLVMDMDFASNPSVVREDSTGMGIEDFTFTSGPNNHLALIWQENSEDGADAYYRIYDPVSSTWGLDARLTQDMDLERSFAPAWNSAGELLIAFNKVKITRQQKSVEVEGGGVIEVEGVPQPGQVDLLLLKHSVTTDVAVVPGSVSAEGTGVLPGDTVTVKALVQNAGDVAVDDLSIGFYDGNPAEGGHLIGTVLIPDHLLAAAEAEVAIPWTIPSPAIDRTIYVVADPAALIEEVDEVNNRAVLPINGVDLAVEYRSGSALPDGSIRVVAKVRNLSAPASPVTTLRLKVVETGATLAESTVSLLEPGISVEIPFDLPPSTHPPGDRAYMLTIDDEDFSQDIEHENNHAMFSLWTDDGSVTFNQWLTNAGVPSGQKGQMDDPDGDGIPNLAGYVFNLRPGMSTVDDYDSALPRISLSGEGAERSVALTYREFQHLTGVTVILEGSNDLESGKWEEITPDAMEDIGVDSQTGDLIRQMRVQLGGSGVKFLRLRFDLPE